MRGVLLGREVFGQKLLCSTISRVLVSGFWSARTSFTPSSLESIPEITKFLPSVSAFKVA